MSVSQLSMFVEFPIQKEKQNKSYSVSPFHAGIDIQTRNKIQNDWIENKTRIIVATSAFGLGINKTDIRLVVHMNIPLNIETPNIINCPLKV